MKKVIIASIIFVILSIMLSARFNNVEETASVHFRLNNGKIDDIRNVRRDFLKEKLKDMRIIVECDEQKAMLISDESKLNSKAITTKPINFIDCNGDFVKTIPENSIVSLKEKVSNQERMLIQYEERVGTVLATGLETDFIEVNIEEQRILMYIRGEILVNSPIVTGTENTTRETPKGIFSIQYKNYDVILEGPGYAYHVYYWMPIYGGIGIHDADGWRSEYGGDIYKSAGSHGCINVPLAIAEKIYENAYKDMTVIIN